MNNKRFSRLKYTATFVTGDGAAAPHPAVIYLAGLASGSRWAMAGKVGLSSYNIGFRHLGVGEPRREQLVAARRGKS